MSEFNHKIDRHVHEPCPECGLDMDITIRITFNGVGEANTMEVESVTERIDHKCVPPGPEPPQDKVSKPCGNTSLHDAHDYTWISAGRSQGEHRWCDGSAVLAEVGRDADREESMHAKDEPVTEDTNTSPDQDCPREDYHPPHYWSLGPESGLRPSEAERFCQGAYPQDRVIVQPEPPTGFCGNESEHSKHWFDVGPKEATTKVRCEGWAPPPLPPTPGLHAERCGVYGKHEPHRWHKNPSGAADVRFCAGVDES